MKSKLLLFAIIVFCSSGLHAQIRQGSILIGGSLGFSTEKNGAFGSTTNRFSISPSIGKAVKENLIAGIDLSYATSDVKNSPGIDLKDNAFGAGFFMRKYAALGKSFYLFGQGRIGGSYRDYKLITAPPPASESRKGYEISLGFHPGIAYSISNKLQLELGLPNFFNMYYSNMDPGNGTRNKSFSLSTALSNSTDINIGLRILLNNHSK